MSLVSPEPAIRIRHLWHRYGNVDVLSDVSFDVGHGEIFGFIGPNGAGKTTTISIMATLLEPMAGRVEIDGFDVSIDPNEVRKLIGYMPDHAGVYDRITIREYLEFFADAYRVQNVGVVDAVIELTELSNLQIRLVSALSKGMKQRLGLARILLHDPKVLILDEPASDLDPRARIEIRDLLLELRELGKTVFLSSHILTELSDVCTSVGILEKGRLVVAGPINEIADRLEAARASDGRGQPTAQSFSFAAAPEAATDSPPTTERLGATEPAAAEAPTGPTAATDPTTTDPTTTPVVGTMAAVSGSTDEPAPPALAAPAALTAGGAAVPGAAHKRLKLRVLGDARAVIPLLQGGGGVAHVEALSGGQLLLHHGGGDRFIAEVVQYLVQRGVAVVGVEPERNELERIFLEYTKGDLQ